MGLNGGKQLDIVSGTALHSSSPLLHEVTTMNNGYRFHRSCGLSPAAAAVAVRDDFLAGRRRYGVKRTIEYYKVATAHGEKHCRWVHNPTLGLRFVGYADKILHTIGHEGWFIDEFQDEVLRGVVYQLPSRNGRKRYAYGYEQSLDRVCAFLSFDPCDNEHDAARWADRMAELEAKAEWEYRIAELEEAEREEEAA